MSKTQLVRLASSLAKNLELNPRTIVNPTHVNLKPSPGYNTEMLGKVFVRNTNAQGKKELTEVSPSTYKELNLLALGGIDFDTPFHMAALLKSLETLLPSKNTLKYGAIFPNADRQTRFEAATTYNKDKLYYSPYIESLTRTLILPRFLNDKTKDLQEPEKPLTLYSFSVGAREIMMIENCFRKILTEDYKASKSDVHQLFGYVKGLSIAYAADYQNLPELRFPKNIILSGADDGILYPKQLTSDIAWSPSLDQTKIHRFTVEENNQYSHPTQIYYVGSAMMPIILDNKTSKNGHSLPHYIEAIKQSELYPIVTQIMGVKNTKTPETHSLKASEHLIRHSESQIDTVISTDDSTKSTQVDKAQNKDISRQRAKLMIDSFAEGKSGAAIGAPLPTPNNTISPTSKVKRSTMLG